MRNQGKRGTRLEFDELDEANDTGGALYALKL